MPRMNRRTFIGSSLAAALANSRFAWAADSRKLDRIGMQLYTVRDLMKTDFEGTLAKVAAIGYNEVEFAGYFDHKPQDVRAMLDKLQLTSPSEHVSYEVVQNKWAETLDAAHIVGHKFIVCPSIDDSQRKVTAGGRRRRKFSIAREKPARRPESSSLTTITYWEFEPLPDTGGKFAYDILLAETDPKLVKMEMDLCWITIAGQDPLTYFNQYPGRFPLVHVKDWTKGPDGKMGEKDGEMADVGSGAIDWKRIFAQSKKAGIQHYFVEHDEPKAPLEDLAKQLQIPARSAVLNLDARGRACR